MIFNAKAQGRKEFMKHDFYEKLFKFTFKNFVPLRFCVLALIFSSFAYAQTLAPGAPGKDAQWATAGKQGVGTSANLESKVWFTLAQGVMTEVYYPDVTVANVHLLQFVVVNPKTKKVETEQDDANYSVKSLETRRFKNINYVPNVSINRYFYSPSSLLFEQTNSSKTGEWFITKTYLTDPKSNSILISVSFQTENPDLELYVYYDPSLGNSGMGDTGWTEGRFLLSEDGKFASALTCGRCKLSDATNGFLGVNDGLTQLRENGKIVNPYSRAEKGNLVQTARIIPVSLPNSRRSMIFSLGFGATSKEAVMNANKTLTKGFETTYREYQESWIEYLKELPKVEPKYQAQFNMAAMILKAHEDKTKRGANIASLTVPWGGGDNANENNIGGYHLIWSRDLYQVATAFWALGDKEAAIRALNFLLKVQQKPDGSFPQNSFLDGKPFWGSLQLDEVAFPLIMAHEFGVHDKTTYENHVKKAADFIVKTGPSTPQERWEEEAGYSPSTIAAEIAGLVCAAEIAKKNSDNESANRWLKTADEWQLNIEKWTVTTTGKYSKEPYYVRITQNGKPDAGEKIELNNGAGFFDEREIVDAGFLELVRLGIKSPDDKIIQNSLKVIDEVIRVKTPNGDGFYRYNNDGYGEMDDGRRWNWDGKYTGKGRLWALLSGERGQYEIARHRFFYPNQTPILEGGLYQIREEKTNTLRKDEYLFDLNSAKFRLDAMLNFANEGLMIPEQIWDFPNVPKNADKQFVPELEFGEGTGSATPLAWSMAQFIRLAVNLQEGRNLDTPQVVYDRYVLGKKDANSLNIKNDFKSIDECLSEYRKRERKKDVDFIPLIPTPLVTKCDGKNLAIFMYEGKEKNVQLAGDFTGWQPKISLTNLSTNGEWKAVVLEFARTARVEYKLIVDGKWLTDPLNPNKVDNGVGGENSFFTMPDYQPTVWDREIKGFKPMLESVEIKSKVFGEKRIVRVFAPALSGSESIPLPVIYFQDGTDYINRAKAIQVALNLANAGKIKPFIMVFIDYKDRMKEYWASDDYATFLATEIVPVIDAKYKTIKSRDGRAVFGASLGGVTAIHTALKYPETFGRIGAQSSSFWIDNERVVKDLEKLDGKISFNFYIDDGTLEGVEDSRKVFGILRQKGYNPTYIEAEVGHNWTAWRDRLADGFVALMN
jgi:glucoamylase